MVLPLSVDVSSDRLPLGNWAVILVTVLAFLALPSGGSMTGGHPLALNGLGPGLLAHVLVHVDVMHLLGNMVFLWVFGNAVCSRLGSLGYLVAYVLFALGAAAAHLLVSDRSACGSSGAVNGVVGMFLVFHPKDYVTVSVLEVGRTFQVHAWVVVGLFLVLDLMGLLSGADGVAYGAHLGGCVAGILVACFLLKTGRVEDPPGATLLDLYWRR